MCACGLVDLQRERVCESPTEVKQKVDGAAQGLPRSLMLNAKTNTVISNFLVFTFIY